MSVTRISANTLLAVVVASLPIMAPSTALAQTSDTEAPQLAGLVISPEIVDVTSAARVVTLSMQVSDNLAGISSASVRLRGPSGQVTSGFRQGTGSLAETLTVQSLVSFYAEPGTWIIDGIDLFDRTGNVNRLSTAQLIANGFPTTFAVVNPHPDLVAPNLQSVSITVTPQGPSGPYAATLDLRVVDDISGVSGLNFSNFDIGVSSPSGQTVYRSQPEFLLQPGGTPTDGLWRTSFNIPQYSEGGEWVVSFVDLVDVSGRRRTMFANELLSRFGSAARFSITTALADLLPPEATGVTIEPTVVETASSSRVVDFSINLRDNVSGLNFQSDTSRFTFIYGFALTSPSGSQRVYAPLYSFIGPTPPSSGTPTDGVWRGQIVLPQFSEQGTWRIDYLALKDGANNRRFVSSASQIEAMGINARLTVLRPSLVTDGTAGPAGGTVTDETFGHRASVTALPGVFSEPVNIAIDVFNSPLDIPLPSGFSGSETYFVNIQLSPVSGAPITYPLPSPGLTIVLPLRAYTAPGTEIALQRVNPTTGALEPSLDAAGNPIRGLVDPGGLTVTFAGIVRLSTIVGLLPSAVPVHVDVKPGEPNTINLKSRGVTPVAVVSSPALDATKLDPATVRLSGTPVARTPQGKWLFHESDVNGDGRQDVIVQFVTQQLLLSPADTVAVVEGVTLDGRRVRGTDTVSVK